MSRRALVGSAVATGALSGRRLTFAQSSPVASPAASPVPGTDFITEATIDDLQTGYQTGQFSVREVVEASIARIRALDDNGPMLNAMIEMAGGVLDQADELDAELASGSSRGPLHGIPLTLKDVFATTDGMSVTAGSLALIENATTREARVVSQLRDAGAIILGKTNMSEWSNWRGVSDGWSSRGGQTLNPYATTYTAWGSSTGSAVAPAASYCVGSIGVETDGSIICPASACAVVGMKPTVGLVSRSGVIPISFTMDSPGPMTRTVKDAAYILQAMVGIDEEDPLFGAFSTYAPENRGANPGYVDAGAVDYITPLTTDGLRNVRVGVVRSLWGFDERADALAETALEAMRDAGAVIIEDVWWDSIGELADGIREGTIGYSEFPWSLQEFLTGYLADGPIQSVTDIANYYWDHPDETAFNFEEDSILVLSEPDLSVVYSDWYQEELQTTLMMARDDGIDSAIAAQNIDVFVAPAATIPVPYDESMGATSTSQMAAIAGYPALTVPIGYADGMPGGMCFFGPAFSEQRLLRYGYALEQTLNARRAPLYSAYPDLWTVPNVGALSDGTDGPGRP